MHILLKIILFELDKIIINNKIFSQFFNDKYILHVYNSNSHQYNFTNTFSIFFKQ